MALTFQHHELDNPIEQMLQGITCLMAYNDSIQGRVCYEAEYVVAACNILNSFLGRMDYSVIMEYPYRSFIGGKTKEEADIVIKKKDTGVVLCVMEFKMSTDANGGMKKDIAKLLQIRDPNIIRLAIVLFQKSLREKHLFVTDNNNARKGKICLKASSYLQQPTNVRVRRVTKIMRSPNSKKPYLTVCVQV